MTSTSSYMKGGVSRAMVDNVTDVLSCSFLCSQNRLKGYNIPMLSCGQQ